MQAYFEPAQTFSISMSQLVFEISIAYTKKHVIQINTDTKFCEIWLPENPTCEGGNLLFGCFYRSRTPTRISENFNLNNLFLSQKEVFVTKVLW